MSYLNSIIPELFLIISIMILLMGGVFYKKSFNLIFKLSAIVLLSTFVLIFNRILNFVLKFLNFIVEYTCGDD